MVKQETPKFKTMEEECEYYESRARGTIGPDAKFIPAKPGRKIKFTVLPLTSEEVDQLARIATRQKVSLDTVIQESLRGTIQRYAHLMKSTDNGKAKAISPIKKKITRARPKTPAAA